MIKNQLKTTMLLVSLFGVFLSIGYALGGQSGLNIAFLFALVFNFASYWYSDKLVLKMYRAKKASKTSIYKHFWSRDLYGGAFNQWGTC